MAIRGFSRVFQLRRSRTFALQQREEALHGGVVASSADAAHGSDEALAVQGVPESPAAVLGRFNQSMQHQGLGATVAAR